MQNILLDKKVSKHKLLKINREKKLKKLLKCINYQMLRKPLQIIIPLQMAGLSGEGSSIILTANQCPWRTLDTFVSRDMVTWYLSAVKMKICSYGSR